MTQEEMRAKETREIYLIDLIIETLLHWRGLIIAIIIGGLLLGGYSMYKSYNAHNTAVAQKEQADKEKEQMSTGNIDIDRKIEDLQKQADSLSEKLTDKNRANVDSALLYADQIDQTEAYFDSSILMNADLSNLPTGDIVVSIIADADIRENLYASYEKLLSSTELYDCVAKNCGYGSEISELIIIGAKNTYNWKSTTVNVDTDEKEDDILIRCYGESIEKCEKIVAEVREYIESKAVDIRTRIGKHELLISAGSVTELCYEDLLNLRNQKRTNLINYKTSFGNISNAFTAEEKQLFELKRTISQEKMLRKAIEEKKIDIPSVGVSKKQLAIGMVGGLFVYAAIICLAYIFSQKIKDSDDFTTTFGTRQLGKVYGTREFKKPLGFIDRWIYSFKRHGRRKIDNAEACDIIATNTALTAEKAEIGKLGIICASGVDNTDGKIVGKLDAALKKEGIESKVLPNILYSNEEAYSLKDMDAVVLVATPEKSKYNEVWDVIEVLENRKIKILGGIMA